MAVDLKAGLLGVSDMCVGIIEGELVALRLSRLPLHRILRGHGIEVIAVAVDGPFLGVLRIPVQGDGHTNELAAASRHGVP